MKKTLYLLALCAVSFITAAAAETLLYAPAFQGANKGYVFWQTKMPSSVTAADGTVKIVFKANEAEKPNIYNAQFIVPYNKGFKAGVKYRVEATVKSSTDLRVKLDISLNQKPWSSLIGKEFNLKADQATPISLEFTPAKDITETYRIPQLTLGMAQAGCTVEVSGVKLFEVK